MELSYSSNTASEKHLCYFYPDEDEFKDCSYFFLPYLEIEVKNPVYVEYPDTESEDTKKVRMPYKRFQLMFDDMHANSFAIREKDFEFIYAEDEGCVETEDMALLMTLVKLITEAMTKGKPDIRFKVVHDNVGTEKIKL